MKKIYLIALSALAVSAFTSCDNEEFLKEDPKTIYTIDNAFDKSSQVDDQITMCYNQAFNLYGFSSVIANIADAYASYYGGNAASTLLGYGSDCLDDAAQRINTSSHFSNYLTLNSNSDRFKYVWNQLYTLISYGNLAIYGSSTLTWSDENDKDYADAQAKFFIGYAYLRLAECFGGVPIVKEFSEQLKYDYVRDSREDVYKYAIENLEFAASKLPDYPKQDGRLSKGVANHFLAEAYIALGTESGDKSYFTKAISAADVTIGLHPLMTKRFGVRANPDDTGTSNGVANYRADGNVFYDLFQMGNYDYSCGNTESVWVMEVPTYDEYAVSGGRMYDLGVTTGQAYRDIQWADEYKTMTKDGSISNGPWMANIDITKYPGATGCAYLGGMNWGVINSNDYIDEYIWNGENEDDMRNSQVVLCTPVCLDQNHKLYGQIVTKEMMQFPFRHSRVSCKVKMQDEWGWDSHHSQAWGSYCQEFGRDQYAVRSAETILLKAEAQLRNGDPNAAAETINLLRKRAQCSHMAQGSEVDLTYILDERARELMWEEHRWPTLLRMDQGDSNTILSNQLKNHAYFYADRENAWSDISWSLFPIPLETINQNTGAAMEQNKGWN